MIKRCWLIFLTLLLTFAASALAEERVVCDHKLYVRERVESTCTRHGWEIVACEKCTYSTSSNLEIAAHDWVLMKEEKSTCITEGCKKFECKNCHAALEEKLELAKHVYEDWTIVREPTCTEKGLSISYCVHCGEKGTASVKKTAHPFGEWCVIREATDRSMGTEERVCSACRLVESRQFYPQGTLYQGMEKNDAVRALQEFLIDKGLLNSRVDGDYGAKTQEAVKKYQQLNGYEPTGVAYPQTLVPLFCTVQGKDGAETMTNTPHVYGDWTILELATVSAQGLRSHECLFCAYCCEEAYDPAGTLRPGMEDSEEVKALQRLLIDKKIISTIADGDYGARTELGVKTFQQMAGLEPTGICYPETLEALKKW